MSIISRSLILAAVVSSFTSCKSTQNVSIVPLADKCVGESVSDMLVPVRDVAAQSLIATLQVPSSKRVLVARSTAFALPPNQIAQSAIAAILGNSEGQRLTAANAIGRCWPQGIGALNLNAVSRAPTAWSRLIESNPDVAGILTVGMPVERSTPDTELIVPIDYRCGDLCGSSWLVMLKREATNWSMTAARQLLQY